MSQPTDASKQAPKHLKIGNWNELEVLKEVDFGVYLDGLDRGEILLPAKYLTEAIQVGESVSAFICYDSEDRLVAVTDEPYAVVGDFAKLEVVATTAVGAFLDWGLEKDLLLPFSEQSRNLRIGEDVIVFVYLDKSQRLAASMRIEKNLKKAPPNYEIGQKVDLLIFGKSDLGYKALIEGGHMGLLFSNEVFRPLNYGDETQGYIRNIRPDGKIDLGLEKTGSQAGDDIAPKILERLKNDGGFLALTDKTPPAIISQLFGVSKKKYKIALGGLYKKRLILIEKDGIRLAVQEGKKS